MIDSHSLGSPLPFSTFPFLSSCLAGCWPGSKPPFNFLLSSFSEIDPLALGPGEMMGGHMVVFVGVWSMRYVDVCECVADGMRIKTQMALSELNVTVGKSSSSSPLLGAAQIVQPEMTARDLRHLLLPTNTPAWSFRIRNTEVWLVSSHSNFELVLRQGS